MHANTADKLGVQGANVGDMLFWDGESWLPIGPGVSGQGLTYCNGKPTWGFCLSTTVPPDFVTSSVALVRGEIINDGGESIIEFGFCYSTAPNPTILDNVIVAGGSNASLGFFSRYLGGLSNNTTYYARTYVKTDLGTFYGNEDNFTTSNELSIGDFHEGGIVFYLLQSGDPGYDVNTPHGLICALNSLSDYPNNWGCIGTEIGGTSNEVFSGQNNTSLIINTCPASAAKIAADYSVNGFSDWYLPSIDTSLLLFQNKIYTNAGILAFGGNKIKDNYWSSTEVDANNAYWQNYNNGNQLIKLKGDYDSSIRPIRSF